VFYTSDMSACSHRLAELRSLAAHHEIATRIESDATIVARALGRLERDYARGITADHYRERWYRLLLGPSVELLERLRADDADARDLRQATPFAGVLTSTERWRLWKQVRESHQDSVGVR
jgi:hypothetical protein